jgi:hypothetical protein
VHFIDRKNFVFALEELPSLNDVEAIQDICEHRLPPYCAGFELWRGERLIYRAALPRLKPIDQDTAGRRPVREPLRAASGRPEIGAG